MIAPAINNSSGIRSICRLQNSFTRRCHEYSSAELVYISRIYSRQAGSVIILSLWQIYFFKGCWKAEKYYYIYMYSWKIFQGSRVLIKKITSLREANMSLLVAKTMSYFISQCVCVLTKGPWKTRWETLFFSSIIILYTLIHARYTGFFSLWSDNESYSRILDVTDVVVRRVA